MEFSVLLLTHNEMLHIGRCLDSLKGVARVVCVDSGSTDGTLKLMKERGVEVLHHPFHSFSEQRNLGMKHFFTNGEWVLHLDADERLTNKLQREILNLNPGNRVAYNIASLTFFQGTKIPRSSSFPVYQTRLTRSDTFQFIEVGHGQKAPPELGPLPKLRNPYEHHPFEKGFDDWLAKHARYAKREAAEWTEHRADYSLSQALSDSIARRQWLKQVSRSNALYPWFVYFYLLIIRGGILEGSAGRTYCKMRFLYELMIQLNVNEENN